MYIYLRSLLRCIYTSRCRDEFDALGTGCQRQKSEISGENGGSLFPTMGFNRLTATATPYVYTSYEHVVETVLLVGERNTYHKITYFLLKLTLFKTQSLFICPY